MAITLNRNKFKYKNPSGSGYRNVDLLEEESKVNDVQVDGTSVVTSGVANIDLSGKADKTDTVLDTTLSRGRKANTTVGTASIAFGDDVTASGNYSQAFGRGSVASGLHSFAEGYNVTASSSSSHAEGQSTKATGLNAHAEGFNTIASASSAHAEGGSTVASNGSAHAEGAGTIASGDRGSHAEGEYSKATGIGSHSEGSYTEANGYGSHGEGINTVANDRGSHVEGMSNVPDSYYDYEEWIPGKQYEVGDKVTRTYAPDNVQGFVCTVANNASTWEFQYWKNTMGTMHYAHIVGNGEYNSPSNAYALDWEGNGHFAGDVYVGANSDSTGGSKLARESIIAPAETATATSAHAIGDKFILDGQLCKATAAIAVGDAITTTGANANAEVTQIVDELGSGGGVNDVQINGTSILDQDKVANIPVAGTSAEAAGVVWAFAGSKGILVSGDGELSTMTATDKNIKEGTNSYRPITASNQHKSAFYALAKAAGDSTQAQSSNPVGTYTDDAKTAIKTMLGIGDSSATQIFNEWVDENNDVGYGAEKVYLCSGPQGEWPIVAGDFRNYAANKLCCLYGDTDSDITPLTSFHEDYINGDYYWTAVFGDRVYRSMSGSEYMYLYAVISPDGLNVVEVTSTTPTITAEDNTRYICTNELSTLDISAVDGLSFQVEFYSGSTPTVLTANSLTWPEWFDSDNLEADCRYEVNVVDCFATVAIWHNVSPV